MCCLDRGNCPWSDLASLGNPAGKLDQQKVICPFLIYSREGMLPVVWSAHEEDTWVRQKLYSLSNWNSAWPFQVGLYTAAQVWSVQVGGLEYTATVNKGQKRCCWEQPDISSADSANAAGIPFWWNFSPAILPHKILWDWANTPQLSQSWRESAQLTSSGMRTHLDN